MRTHRFLSLVLTSLWVSLYVCGAKPNYTIRLYENSQPVYQNGYTPEDEWVERKDRIYKISDPRLDIYLPQGGKAKGILLSIPGGGYRFVSSGNEGTQVADFFVPRNYAVAVLKYRLPNQHENVPLEDALQAMRILRDSAAQWAIEKAAVGVMGFSAGGHLAASLLTHYTDSMTRPDYGVLIYPVISMDDEITHKGSCKHLLGETPTPEQRNYWSAEKQVTADTPPCLIVTCQDDPTVQIANSIRFYEALTAHKIPSSLVIVPVGKHGWGFSRQFQDREIIDQAIISFIDP